MNTPLTFRVALAAVFAAASAAPAGAADPAAGIPAGQKVVVKLGTQLKQGDQVLAILPWGTVYGAEAVNGSWAWVAARDPKGGGTLRGWVKDSRLAPLPPPVRVTKQVEADPAYAGLASVLADPASLLGDDETPNVHTPHELAALYRETLTRLAKLEDGSAAELRELVRQTRAELGAMFDAARELDEHPTVRAMRPKGQAAGDLEFGLGLSLTGPCLSVGYNQALEAAATDQELDKLRLKVTGATEQLQTVRAVFFKLAQGRGGQAAFNGQPILSKYSRRPVIDRNEFVNLSGADLTNCVLFVDVEDRAGGRNG